MSKFFLVVLIIAAFLGFLLGIDWLVWKAWLWVVPQLWPTGPEGLINPGFWLFVVAWILMGLVGSTIFGPSKSK